MRERVGGTDGGREEGKERCYREREREDRGRRREHAAVSDHVERQQQGLSGMAAVAARSRE